MVILDIACEYCGKIFQRSAADARKQNRHFCSRECYWMSKRGPNYSPRPKINQCDRCGVLLESPTAKFCDECRPIHTSEVHSVPRPYAVKRTQVPCATCGVLVWREPNQLRTRPTTYCSRECVRLGRVSSIERTVAEELERRQLLYDAQMKVGQWWPDFIVGQTIIEVDGDYWHNLPGASERDRRKDQFYQENGFDVIRIWGHEVEESDFSKLDALIA